MSVEFNPIKRSPELQDRINKVMSVDYKDIGPITQKHLDSVKGNPNASTRQYLGLMRTTEEEYTRRDEILKRPLP